MQHLDEICNILTDECSKAVWRNINKQTQSHEHSLIAIICLLIINNLYLKLHLITGKAGICILQESCCSYMYDGGTCISSALIMAKGVLSSYNKLTCKISGIYVSQLMFWDKLCIVDHLIIWYQNPIFFVCTLPIQVRNNTPNSPDRCKLYDERTPFIWNTLYIYNHIL